MKSLRLLLIGLGALALGHQAKADPVVAFTLDPPNGILAGQAGTSVGWGFSITTDSDFVTIETIAFGEATPIGVFTALGLPSSAAFSGSPISTAWVQGSSGLQYDISPLALLGASTQGVMTLIYDAYTDPGLTNQVIFGNTVNAQFNSADLIAEVDVNAAAANQAPEPAGIGLVALGLAALCCARRLSGAGR